MTNDSLARSYLVKARVRLKILAVLQAEQAWSDVIRESQEVVELALKALLREVGVEPPKWHDVGGLLREHRERFSAALQAHIDRLAAITWPDCEGALRDAGVRVPPGVAPSSGRRRAARLAPRA